MLDGLQLVPLTTMLLPFFVLLQCFQLSHFFPYWGPGQILVEPVKTTLVLLNTERVILQIDQAVFKQRTSKHSSSAIVFNQIKEPAEHARSRV